MIKRFFDLLGSFCSLLLFGWIIVLSYFVATLDNRSSGFFLQKRVGQYGRPFTIIKIKTMKEGTDGLTRISRTGSFFRRTKIDELPQLAPLDNTICVIDAISSMPPTIVTAMISY